MVSHNVTRARAHFSCASEEETMALRSLLLEEMVRISEPWLDSDKEAYRILNGNTVLAGIQPLIAQAHAALTAALPTDHSERVAQLTAAMAEADGEHDRRLRAVYETLCVLAPLDGTGQIKPLLEKLLPDGLAHNSRTYRAEAGYASLVQSRLTADDRALLASQGVGQTTALSLVEAWLSAGRRLGELEEERVQLENTGRSAAGAANEARLGWIRVVNALLPLAELAGCSDGDQRALFAALHDAEAKADQRASRGRSNDSSEGEPTAAAPVGEAGA